MNKESEEMSTIENGTEESPSDNIWEIKPEDLVQDSSGNTIPKTYAQDKEISHEMANATKSLGLGNAYTSRPHTEILPNGSVFQSSLSLKDMEKYNESRAKMSTLRAELVEEDIAKAHTERNKRLEEIAALRTKFGSNTSEEIAGTLGTAENAASQIAEAYDGISPRRMFDDTLSKLRLS
jgi:hypothetical protein